MFIMNESYFILMALCSPLKDFVVTEIIELKAQTYAARIKSSNTLLVLMENVIDLYVFFSSLFSFFRSF